MNRFEFYNNLDKFKTNSLQHDLEYGKQHYAKIDNYYAGGRARYFWTKEEWDAYQREKQGEEQDKFKKNQAQKKTALDKEAERGNDMSGYNKWKKEQEEKNLIKTKVTDSTTGMDFNFTFDSSKIDQNTLNKIKTGVTVNEELDNQTKEVQDKIDKTKKNIRLYMTNPGNYSLSGWDEKAEQKHNSDIKYLIEQIPEYQNLMTSIGVKLNKAIDTGEWPEWEKFWNNVDSKADNIAKDYFKLNFDDEHYNAEQTRNASNYSVKVKNMIMEEAHNKWNAAVKRAKQKSEIAKIKIKNSDEAQEVNEMLKKIYQYDDMGEESDNGGHTRKGHVEGEWDKKWEDFDKRVTELANQLKENDKDNELSNLSIDNIKRILTDNAWAVNLHNDDKYGLNNRLNEERRSQFMTQNSNKTEESIQEAISEDLYFLEKDFSILTDTQNNWQSSWTLGKISSQQQHDTCADVDSRLKNIRKEEYHDPDTGLPIKAYETTFEEDVSLVNYHRQLEKDMQQSWEYSENCSGCTVALCLRMKGYDVSAAPRGESFFINPDYSKVFKDYPKQVLYNDKTEFYDRINSEPAGSYGNISVSWNSGSGHSMFYRITDNGTFEIWDAQSNFKMDVDDLLKRSHDWQLDRLDDKEVNGYMATQTGYIIYY